MHASDHYIKYILELAEALEKNSFERPIALSTLNAPSELGDALEKLERAMLFAHKELNQLNQITESINAGTDLIEVLDLIYDSFQEIIPYDRIGFSLLKDNNTKVESVWSRSRVEDSTLPVGYSALLKHTSLEETFKSKTPRILNDLKEYYKKHPSSQPTKILLEMGMRSSLTCPLIVSNNPAGLLFFSSMTANIYANAHVIVFKQIAAELSATIHRSRLLSDLVEKQVDLEKKNKELEQLNDLKNTLLGMAAHDLRNPLVQVLWNCEMLLDKEVKLTPVEYNSMGDMIQRSCEHMLSLIDNLLDVSMIEQGKLILENQAFFLENLLSESINAHMFHAQQKDISLQLKPLEKEIISIADPSRIRQVIDNFVSNAIKYSPAHSNVIVSAEEIEHKWCVKVKDQGPGLTKEDKTKLFGDFQKLSARPTGGEKSSGLGLAIAKRIVTAHGGTIGVDSERGQGATFWFKIPKPQ